MAAITQNIPNLMGGVSQQPDPIKIPGQVREAKNVFLDPTFGCKKRPPTKFIAALGTGEIPADAQWFPIFRDQTERYIVCIYRDNNSNTVVRVWEADSGIERGVTTLGSAADYLTVQTPKNLKTLTVNDYTILVNKEKVVTMASNVVSQENQEALVIINQISYNTTYAIDFLKDGNLTQEKVYRASRLSVDPGSFEVDGDNGSCALAAVQSFVRDSGAKTGLSFTLKTECQPTLVTTDVPGKPYPVGLTNVTSEGNKNVGGTLYDKGQNYTATHLFGQADNYVRGSYLYHTFTTSLPQGDITVRVEFRVVETPDLPEGVSHNEYLITAANVVGYTTTDTPWVQDQQYATYIHTLNSDLDPSGDNFPILPAGSKVGIRFRVSNVKQGPTTQDFSYKSDYKVKVTLNNGGLGWRKGDSVSVTMAGKNYTIRVEEDTFGYSYVAENNVSYTSPADTTSGVLDVGTIVGDLVTDINGIGPYTATPIGNVIHIVRNDGREFNIQTRGGSADNAMTGIKGAVNDLSVLPEQCKPGMVLKVRNSADSSADDYYVKFVSSDGDIPGQGSWEETVAPGIPTDLNPSTMPHALIREANGDFVVRPLSREYDDKLYWSGREVGDEQSNPTPTFVGRTISEAFFFMNRLGFLSADAVIMSQPADFFNFFQTSAIAVSDADPIDVTASSTKPANLKAAVGTTKGLLLFAENNQFLLATDEPVFGPATVKMNEIGSYSYNSDVPPLETGVSVFFTTEADTYTKVFEMAIDSIDNRPLVSENTRIIPEYIPPKLTTATSSPNNSFVVLGNDTNTLWTFKFYNIGNERSLAGWTKWEMPAQVKLVSFNHDTGYMVLYNDPFTNDFPPAAHVTHPTYTIVKFEMLDDPKTSPISVNGRKFIPRLDSYLLPDEIVTEPGTDITKLRFPEGAYVEYMQPNVIVTVDGEATLFARPQIQSDPTGYFVEVSSDVVDADFIMGLEYNMSVELPSFYLTQENRADRKNLPIVEHCYIDLYLSGRYQVLVKKQGYEPVELDLDVTIADIYQANQPAIEEVITKSIPIFSRGDYVNVTISSPDPLPSAVTSYSWEGHYSTRGINKIR